MAVPSKSSLRFSSRRNNTLPSDSPTVDKSTSATRATKRARTDSSAVNGDFKSSKKQKIDQKSSLPKNAIGDPHTLHKSLSNNHDVTAITSAINSLLSPNSSRVTSAVQPPPDGTIIPSKNNASRATSTHGDLLAPSNLSANGSTVGKEGDKRTLRSQDGGSRSKSELSLYFPNYEELISNEPKEPELLTSETRLFVSEEPPKSPIATNHFLISSSPTKTSPSKRRPSSPGPKPPPSPTNAQTIDFSSLLTTLPENATDPLPSPLFHKAHRRAERQEKQLRNIEKERAQHEKIQLERILEGLRGHDWLRVMGISGITEGERKSWEGKRAWCIQEVNSLLEKFRLWKEEERRRKLEKEISVRDEDEEDDGDRATPSTANASDVDALAALQLHTETLSASTPTASKPNPKPRGRGPRAAGYLPPAAILLPPEIPDPEQPFTSFFAKPHLRAAAMENHRRSGRTRYAFGQPVPELDILEFELPNGFVTDEARKASARDRRRRRRNIKDEAKK